MKLLVLLWLPAALAYSSRFASPVNTMRKVRPASMTRISMSERGSYNKLALKGIGTLAGAGVLETSYLSWAKFANIPVLCTGDAQSSSCMDVISSPYATIPVFDIPLTAIAVIGYFSVMVMSLLQLSKDDDNESIVGPALLFLATAMGTFSTYLMTILTFLLNKECIYCYISAFLSLSIAALAWFTRIGILIHLIILYYSNSSVYFFSTK